MPFCHTLKAPAKINLLLRVTGKRADGFHELVTFFHPVPAVSDSIRANLSASPGITAACPAPEVPENGDNLVVRAAAAFAGVMGISPAWHFELEKNIPVSAGMGGGSSDAGTVLRFLAEKYPGCSEEKLRELALSIGADVPFFLAPGDAAGRGIGEKIEPAASLPMPPVLAIFPNFPVSAAWAYRHLESITPPEQAEEELAGLVNALRQRDFCKAAALCANDLEAPLFKKFPLLDLLRRDLLDKGALCVHVSGSGPTLFALFANRAEQQTAARSLASPENLETGIKIMEC